VLWTRRYNGPGNQDDLATVMATSPDGSRVFIGGYMTGATTGWDFATVSYDASTGHQVWASSYDGGVGTDVVRGLGVSPDGSMVFVTGSSSPPAGWSDYATVAYDAGGGAQLWVGRYDGHEQTNDSANALGVSPDGSQVFVTGGSTGVSGNFDYATLSYDAHSGVELWVDRYDGPEQSTDIASALGVSPDGSAVFITGWSAGSMGYLDYVSVAYSTA
jgi:hypothetical protein